MSPKEKAQRLVNNCYSICMEFTEEIQCHLQAKQCALIAVDEVINANPSTEVKVGGSDNRGDWSYTNLYDNKNYWQQVKTEIENL